MLWRGISGLAYLRLRSRRPLPRRREGHRAARSGMTARPLPIPPHKGEGSRLHLIDAANPPIPHNNRKTYPRSLHRRYNHPHPPRLRGRDERSAGGDGGAGESSPAGPGGPAWSYGSDPQLRPGSLRRTGEAMPHQTRTTRFEAKPRRGRFPRGAAGTEPAKAGDCSKTRAAAPRRLGTSTK